MKETLYNLSHFLLSFLLKKKKKKKELEIKKILNFSHSFHDMGANVNSGNTICIYLVKYYR